MTIRPGAGGHIESHQNQLLVAESFTAIGQMLGSRPDKTQKAKLLSRHWTVFQIPSATTANFYYLVAGSKKDGWLCTCVGFQANKPKPCYHIQAVIGALENGSK